MLRQVLIAVPCAQCQQPGPVPNSQQAADEAGTLSNRTGPDTPAPLGGRGGGAGAAAGGAGSDAGGHSGPVLPQPSGGSSSSLAAVLGLGRKSSGSGIAGPGGKQASGGGSSTPRWVVFAHVYELGGTRCLARWLTCKGRALGREVPLLACKRAAAVMHVGSDMPPAIVEFVMHRPS